jgi:phage tail protein X
MLTYRTQDKEMVDMIAFRHYGRQDGGLVEAVYAANRGLAALGPKLPAGTLVVLPDAPALPVIETVTLWE